MGAKYARVSRFEGPVDTLDESVQIAQQRVMPEARKIKGFQGAIALVDRATGRSLAITLWDSAESMGASEARADELRETGHDQTGERTVGVERYEIAFLEQVTL